MRKLWWISGVATLAVAGTAFLVVSRIQAVDAEAARKKAAAASVTLEFSPTEVVSPRLDRMPRWIEFSGRWSRRQQRLFEPGRRAPCCR